MSMTGYQPKGTTYQKSELIDVLGTWTGVEDELTETLTRLGYSWIIQQSEAHTDANGEHPEGEQVMLSVAGKYLWDSTNADVGDVVFIQVFDLADDNRTKTGRLRSFSTEALKEYTEVI